MVRPYQLPLPHEILRFCCSDSAVKLILVTLNERQSFIIEDLDDHNVVIKADEEWRVRRELEAEVSSLAFVKRFSPFLTPSLARKEYLQSRIRLDIVMRES